MRWTTGDLGKLAGIERLTERLDSTLLAQLDDADVADGGVQDRDQWLGDADSQAARGAAVRRRRRDWGHYGRRGVGREQRERLSLDEPEEGDLHRDVEADDLAQGGGGAVREVASVTDTEAADAGERGEDGSGLDAERARSGALDVEDGCTRRSVGREAVFVEQPLGGHDP